MAVTAEISSSHMDLMAEFYRFHVLFRREIVSDRLQHGMALLAVILDREGIFPVMTEPAGKALLHIGHGISLVILFRNESLVVTIVAPVQVNMKLMAENRSGIPEF